MKLKRIVMSMLAGIIMVTGCLLTTNTKVSAKGLDSKESQEIILELSEEEIKVYEKEQIKAITDSYNNSKADGWEYDWRPVGSENKKVNIGYAGAQPSGGTVFNSPGGFYWQDGGYNRTVSVGVSYGVFSVSVSAGKSSSSGRYISSPWTKVPVKLHVAKDIKVQKYSVYRRSKYAGGQWQFYKTDYTKTPYRDYLTVDRV